LRYDGPATDDDLVAAYRACTFTVYPSLCEGFGLPVIESLAQGKPCICSAHGALGESAQGGGCIMLEQVNAEALRHAIDRLVKSPREIATLAALARGRRFRTWHDYASDLVAWMSELPRAQIP
jgi:glycosyltransferase involved in cell wall biosynthesis